MNMNFFKTDKVRPFLFHGRKNSQVCLFCELPDEAVPITMNEVWRKCTLIQRELEAEYTLLVSLNIARNHVAQASLRSVANIVWLHPETETELKRQAGVSRTHVGWDTGLTFIIDEDVPVNELRVCYHKFDDRAVSGPFQVVNGKQYHNPSYMSFFARAVA